MTEQERTLTYQQWVDEYSPVFEDSDGASLVQYPSWNSLPDGIDTRLVWAVTEAEDEWFILPGYHLVNVLYFAVTRKPLGESEYVVVEWGD